MISMKYGVTVSDVEDQHCQTYDEYGCMWNYVYETWENEGEKDGFGVLVEFNMKCPEQ